MNTADQKQPEPQAEAPRTDPREPYTPPVIEMFPPMHDVSFGSNVNPTSATGFIP